MERPSRLLSGLTADRAAGIALVAFGTLAIVESRGLPMGTLHQPGPAYFPVALSIALIAFGAVLTLFAGAGARLKELGWEEARHALLIMLGAGVATYLLERVGYVIAMTALMLYLLIVVARRHWAASALFALALAGGTFALFDLALRVLLPRSPWGFF
ncbi:MAG TPA: tripartite tricarboxylate transporter TctB family protein [Alphaproteobacteria bacterium]|jgi:putative tricarboxylic transport membrane protein